MCDEVLYKRLKDDLEFNSKRAVEDCGHDDAAAFYDMETALSEVINDLREEIY